MPPADHVAQVYGDDYFNGGGAGYPDYLAEGALLLARGQWYARQLARYMATGKMLDVGAAAGFVLRGFTDAGWDGEGVEPNSSMAGYAREALGLRVLTGDLASLPGDRRYDLVSMIQVIAHVVAPKQALAKVATLLNPGGFLLIETWNSASLTARTMGRRWHEYSPPSVLHCFSLKSLGRLATDAGFREITRGRPSKWISSRHAKELLLHKLGDSRWGRALAELIPHGVNLPYPAEDLAWVLLRKHHDTHLSSTWRVGQLAG